MDGRVHLSKPMARRRYSSCRNFCLPMAWASPCRAHDGRVVHNRGTSVPADRCAAGNDRKRSAWKEVRPTRCSYLHIAVALPPTNARHRMETGPNHGVLAMADDAALLEALREVVDPE